MSTLALPLRYVRVEPIAVLVGALVIGAALVFIGPVAGFVLLALGVGAFLFMHPRLLLGVFLALALLAESDEEAVLPFRTLYWAGPPSAADALFALLVAATVADIARRHRPVRLPGPLTIPLVALALAAAAGVVNGYLSGGDVGAILDSFKGLALLVVLPFVVVNLLDGSRHLEAVAVGAAAVAAVRSVEGMSSWLAGAGRTVGDTTLTFYAPGPNFLLLLVLLGVLASAATRLKLPVWVYLAAPVCLAAFVLSFRRNFWIGALVATALLLMIGSGMRGRRILAVAIATTAFAIYGALAVADWQQLEGPVAERASSLTPSRLRAERYDRYRIDEARNVLATIRERPVVGVGLGVPWEAKHALPVEFEGGRLYTHATPLWYWLKLGVLGLAAYAALHLVAIACAFVVGRRHPSPLVRAAGVAVAAGLVGLVIAETTGAFTGVSDPLTILVATAYGWVAVAYSEARRTPVAAA